MTTANHEEQGQRNYRATASAAVRRRVEYSSLGRATHGSTHGGAARERTTCIRREELWAWKGTKLPFLTIEQQGAMQMRNTKRTYTYLEQQTYGLGWQFLRDTCRCELVTYRFLLGTCLLFLQIALPSSLESVTAKFPFKSVGNRSSLRFKHFIRQNYATVGSSRRLNGDLICT